MINQECYRMMVETMQYDIKALEYTLDNRTRSKSCFGIIQGTICLLWPMRLALHKFRVKYGPQFEDHVYEYK